MPHTFELSKENKLLTVISKGDINVEESKKLVEYGIDLYNTKIIDKVILDVRQQSSTVNIGVLFGLTEKLPNDAKIAILVSESLSTLQSHKFLETAGYNSGKMLKLFFEVEKANNWLGIK